MVLATNITSICCVYKLRKLLKALIPENVASTQIQKLTIFDSDRKKINLILNKSFRYYNL